MGCRGSSIQLYRTTCKLNHTGYPRDNIPKSPVARAQPSHTLYIGSFSKSRCCIWCLTDPDGYEVYCCTDTRLLAEMYRIALKTTAWMWHKTLAACTISQDETFFYVVVKTNPQKLVCSKWLFSVRHTHFYHLPCKAWIHSFSSILTSLNSISLGRQPTFRVFGWSHMFEAKTRSAFKLICFVIFCCLMCSSDMGRLPGATCRYSCTQ